MSDVKSAEQIAEEKAQAKAAKEQAAAEKKEAAEKAKAEKVQAAAQAKAEREEKAAQAKAEKDRVAAEKAEAKAKAAAEKAAAAGAPKEKVVMPSKNGITRPKDGTKTAGVWAIADRMTEAKGSPVAIAELGPECAKQGLNDATTRTQYARWKTFNGIFGQVAKAAVPVETETRAAA